MRKRNIHQWRDWLLDHTGGDNYELTHKATKEVFAIVAKDSMDAENKSQEIIKKASKERS